MKYVKQFTLILLFSFVGELLNKLLPLPVPASIYGLVLLFLCLEFKLIKLEQIKETSDFLLGIMPLLFVPSSVGLITAAGIMKKYGIQFVAVAVITTFAVMIVTGHVVQLLMKLFSRNKSKHEKDTE